MHASDLAMTHSFPDESDVLNSGLRMGTDMTSCLILLLLAVGAARYVIGCRVLHTNLRNLSLGKFRQRDVAHILFV